MENGQPSNAAILLFHPNPCSSRVHQPQPTIGSTSSPRHFPPAAPPTNTPHKIFLSKHASIITLPNFVTTTYPIVRHITYTFATTNSSPNVALYPLTALAHRTLQSNPFFAIPRPT
ncbi:hypothetical protein PG996_015083 [Apiospora saccharicola]|uniref:Uncharacterized protein n=1 Tax=Apiospora saccharicola TaxID=335842 RepID=A0ABR1TK63_9PEZI